jgi:UPF0755 protein
VNKKKQKNFGNRCGGFDSIAPMISRKLRSRLVLLIFALVLCGNLGSLAVDQCFGAPGPLGAGRAVVIPAKGTAAAAGVLVQDGVIRYPLVFRGAAWLTRKQGPVRAGEYEIPARASLREILQILRFAAPVQHQVTIPEGLTAVQIARILNSAAATRGRIAVPAEGSVLPQTYDYILGTPVAKIAARAGVALQTAVAAAWAGRDPGIPLASPGQAVILASIVQEETPLAVELPRIAAVYENRLARNMRLQADPSVIYAASNGASAAGRVISRDDLANPSPYNTYAHAGLPPGPICAPGIAAIEAVLHPLHSNALYFVATGAGGHVFADTFKAQLANIAAYRH